MVKNARTAPASVDAFGSNTDQIAKRSVKKIHAAGSEAGHVGYDNNSDKIFKVRHGGILDKRKSLWSESLARREPGIITYASASKGTAAHLFAELFASLADVQLVAVHYKGAAPAMNDVMGGHVPFTFDVVLTTLSQIKAGKLKALAVTSERRSPALPDVPTIAESGFPGYNAVGWNGLFAPAGTPRETVSRLAAEVSAILNRPEVREKIASQGDDIVGGTPDQFAAFIRADSAKWAQLIKKQNITPD